jgi:hypothetical protein
LKKGERGKGTGKGEGKGEKNRKTKKGIKTMESWDGRVSTLGGGGFWDWGRAVRGTIDFPSPWATPGSISGKNQVN